MKTEGASQSSASERPALLSIDIQDLPQKFTQAVQETDALDESTLSEILETGFTVRPGEAATFETISSDYEIQ